MPRDDPSASVQFISKGLNKSHSIHASKPQNAAAADQTRPRQLRPIKEGKRVKKTSLFAAGRDHGSEANSSDFQDESDEYYADDNSSSEERCTENDLERRAEQKPCARDSIKFCTQR